eukprot:scaffold4282_cov112-Cylindrotheca_fusiformis.AAC.2
MHCKSNRTANKELFAINEEKKEKLQDGNAENESHLKHNTSKQGKGMLKAPLLHFNPTLRPFKFSSLKCRPGVGTAESGSPQLGTKCVAFSCSEQHDPKQQGLTPGRFELVSSSTIA